ncbi:MAG: HAD hydrolase family protein [Parcubacteria group bacterium]
MHAAGSNQKRRRGNTWGFAGIRVVFFDFDGVFTNNQVLTLQDGTEGVLSNRSDGLGIQKLRRIGIHVVILSTEKNIVVESRAKKLHLPCYQGLDDKLTMLQKVLTTKRILPKNAAYVGNDINDLPCLKFVGFPVAVADAYPEVKRVCTTILKKNGGYGAVREFCDTVAHAVSQTKK